MQNSIKLAQLQIHIKILKVLMQQVLIYIAMNINDVA